MEYAGFYGVLTLPAFLAPPAARGLEPGIRVQNNIGHIKNASI